MNDTQKIFIFLGSAPGNIKYNICPVDNTETLHQALLRLHLN